MFINVNNTQKIKKFNEKLNRGNIIVLYYANWCGHCQQMKPEWNKFKKEIIPLLKKKKKEMTIAEIESSVLENNKQLFQVPIEQEVQGFPTIKYYENNNNNSSSENNTIPQFNNLNNKGNNLNNNLRSISYDGNRDKEAFINFVLSHSVPINKGLNNNSPNKTAKHKKYKPSIKKVKKTKRRPSIKKVKKTKRRPSIKKVKKTKRQLKNV